MLLTRSPLIHPKASALDLHVLSTPPAFVLSQDQTLQQKLAQQTETRSRQNISGTTTRTMIKLDTLLSSQKTPAHHRDPRGPGRGNFPRLSGPCLGVELRRPRSQIPRPWPVGPAVVCRCPAGRLWSDDIVPVCRAARCGDNSNNLHGPERGVKLRQSHSPVGAPCGAGRTEVRRSAGCDSGRRARPGLSCCPPWRRGESYTGGSGAVPGGSPSGIRPGQEAETRTPARLRLPRRTTSHPPGRRSSAAGVQPSSTTFALLT